MKESEKRLQRGADLALQQYFLTAGGMYTFFFTKNFCDLAKTIL